MNDYIDEELQIMNERDRAPKNFNTEALKDPIGILCDHPIETMDGSATVGEAIRLMQKKNFGALPVTRKGKLVGILTERDILIKVVGIREDFHRIPLSEVMSLHPAKLHKDDAIAYAMNKMHGGGFRHVTVVNEKDEPIHMISIKDVIRYILDHFPQEVVNLPQKPARGGVPREGG